MSENPVFNIILESKHRDNPNLTLILANERGKINCDDKELNPYDFFEKYIDYPLCTENIRKDSDFFVNDSITNLMFNEVSRRDKIFLTKFDFCYNLPLKRYGYVFKLSDNRLNKLEEKGIEYIVIRKD